MRKNSLIRDLREYVSIVSVEVATTEEFSQIVSYCYTSCQFCPKFFTVQNSSSCGKVMFSQACIFPSVHGGGGRGAWQGTCIAGGVHGGGGGRVWQERRPLQRTVCILLECILVFFFIQMSDLGSL